MSNVLDFPIGVLENENIRLEYLTSAGPRVTGLSYRGSANLLAEVRQLAWATPHGVYHPIGGHRLWTSPESPQATYLPDEKGLEVRPSADETELTWSGYGLRKSIKIGLFDNPSEVRLQHTVTNLSGESRLMAPWAITMMRLGGTAILPQPSGNVDDAGLLPNRNLVLWPYTQLADPRLDLADDFILIRGNPALPPVKVGYLNKAGWIAYWNNGVLFRISFEMDTEGSSLPDGGCNVEVYCNNYFLELETLGPLASTSNGDSVQLTETWEVFPSLDVDFIPASPREKLA